MREKSVKTKKKKTAFGVIRKIFNVLGVLLILLLTALCIFLIYQRVSGQEPKLFGYRLFEVQTGSMEPTIMTGDTILTKEYKDISDIQIGDIVVFKNDQIWINVGKPELKGNYIVHRVIFIDRAEGYIITLGDNNHGISDPQTNLSAVEAKYVTKFSGGFFRFIRSPFGIVAIIAALVAIFAAMRLVYALNEKRKKKKAEETSLKIEGEAPEAAESDVSESGSDDKTVSEETEKEETNVEIVDTSAKSSSKSVKKKKSFQKIFKKKQNSSEETETTKEISEETETSTKE